MKIENGVRILKTEWIALSRKVTVIFTLTFLTSIRVPIYLLKY